MNTKIAILLLASLAPAQTYTSRAPFLAAGGSSPVMVENFNGFGSGAQVAALFGGLITFQAPIPTDFFGSWGLGSLAGKSR